MRFPKMHYKKLHCTMYHPLPTTLSVKKLTHSFKFKGNLSIQIPKYLNKKHIQVEVFTLMTRTNDQNVFTLNDINVKLFKFKYGTCTN